MNRMYRTRPGAFDSVDERMMAPPHVQVDGSRFVTVYPSRELICLVAVDETGTEHPAIRIDTMTHPSALLHLLNIDELRAIAAWCTREGDKLEADAAAALPDFLKPKGPTE